MLDCLICRLKANAAAGVGSPDKRSRTTSGLPFLESDDIRRAALLHQRSQEFADAKPKLQAWKASQRQV